jgi:tetratricopeptide (TPR) repeat protein
MSIPLEVFFSYAPEDEEYRKRLAKALRMLEREELITGWHDQKVSPGIKRASEIDAHLESAHIILLLISPDFLASDYYWEKEAQTAMKRSEARQTRVIPILVRPSDWTKTLFSKLQALPTNGKPVTLWANKDEAFLNITQGIRDAVSDIKKNGVSSQKTNSPIPPIKMIPYRRNPFFTGRDDILIRLHNQLQTTKKAALSQPVAMSGLGGVGKTQVAVEYAYRYRENYQTILWVNASNPQEMLEDFARLASVLQLPEQNAQEQQQTIQAVKQWLDTHTDWLLIFDNADTLADIYDYLPQENKGHILLTTRAQTMSGIAQKIEIKTMASEEGISLILKRAGILPPDVPLTEASETDHDGAQIIVDLMGGLPLALDQAGAYIEETQESLSNYILLFQQQRAILLKNRGGHISLNVNAKDKASSDHLPVTTTWSMAFEKIKQANPSAIELICLCAFLTPDAIPEDLLTENVALFNPLLQSAVTNRDTFNKTLALLIDYSLLSREPRSHTLNMHRLIQAVIKDEMTEEQHVYWSQVAIHLVSQIFPFDEPAPWPKSLRYILSGLLAIEYINRWNVTSNDATELLNTIGTYFVRHGQYNEAEKLYQHALATMQYTLGPEHPNTLSSMNNLASLYSNQGKYEQAEELCQCTLTTRKRILGPEHLDTLSSMGNLAILYKNQGKYKQAEELYQRALAIGESTLRPEHPNILSNMNNLAVLYYKQGKYEQAEELHQRALAIRERILGPEHPDTLMSMSNLAILYDEQGKYEQAEELYQRALATMEHILGPEHPDTLSNMNNLAGLYDEQGKYEQAEELYQRALVTRERILGSEHPDTLNSVNNLAVLYDKQGKHKQAEELYQYAQDTMERILGPEHPNTLMSVSNLASLYYNQGKYKQAEKLYQHAQDTMERILGPEHPDTLMSVSNLASLYYNQGKYKQAEELYQRALTAFEKVLDPEHPTTSHVRQNYANLQQELQTHEE